ncbi:MAG TPA: hypothetical protein VMT20_29570 [Terriglobia bacterium]|nr:hypothetical protein [Terriglobia bacterium]
MSRDWSRRQAKERANERGRLGGLIIALTIAGLSARASAQVVSPPAGYANLKITLRMYNSGISRSLLVRAGGEAASILSQAGLEPVWVDCPLTPAESEGYAACQSPMGPADFAIKILTAREADQFSSYHEAMGQALECARNEVGCSAYIFYRDVLELARDGDAAEYQLLGHAIAHEIGHLLLGPNSHSAAGLMRRKWNDRDLETIARGYLFFTDAQSKHIRSQVSARNTIRQDQVASAEKP